MICAYLARQFGDHQFEGCDIEAMREAVEVLLTQMAQEMLTDENLPHVVEQDEA